MKKLTQEQVDTLISMEKNLLHPEMVKLPDDGKTDNHDLDLEIVKLSLYKGKRNPLKASYKLLHKGRDTLLRLDLNPNGIHYNSDGQVFERGVSHLHIYREGHGDSFAIELPEVFSNPKDLIASIYHFLQYSNIINHDKVIIQGGLWNE